MAPRKAPVNRWIEQALGTDETRPVLLKPAISEDDPNIRICTDEHRLHLADAKIYSVEITNDWKSPTDFLFRPKKGFKIIKTFDRKQLVSEIEELVYENLDNKLFEQIKDLDDSAKLFKGIKSDLHRDGFEESVKETLAILREYRNPRSAVSLQKWLGVNVHLNPRYLFEALNYPHGKIVSLSSDGDELGPVIVEYLDVNLAACIMPMRH